MPDHTLELRLDYMNKVFTDKLKMHARLMSQNCRYIPEKKFFACIEYTCQVTERSF